MFVDLIILHVIRMSPIISSVAYPILSYFSTLRHKRNEFRDTATADTVSAGTVTAD